MIDLPGGTGVALSDPYLSVTGLRTSLGTVLIKIILGQASAEALWFPYRNTFVVTETVDTTMREVYQAVRFAFYCPPFFEEKDCAKKISPSEGKLNEAFFATRNEISALSEDDRRILGDRNCHYLFDRYLEDLVCGKYLNDSRFKPRKDLVITNCYKSLGILTHVIDWMVVEVVMGSNLAEGSFRAFVGTISHNSSTYRDCFLEGNFNYRYDTRIARIEITGYVIPDSVKLSEDIMRTVLANMWLPGTGISFDVTGDSSSPDPSSLLTQLWG